MIGVHISSVTSRPLSKDARSIHYQKGWFTVGLFSLIFGIFGSIIEFVIFTFQSIVNFLFGIPG